MSLNTTNIRGPANTLSYNATVNNVGFPSINESYGLGKIVQGAFAAITDAWQKIWDIGPSSKKALPFSNLEKAHTRRSLQQKTSWPASFNLATLDGTNGFTVPGVTTGVGYVGYSVSHAGDLNGDGLTDLVLGANGISMRTGAAYVLFGQAGGWPASFNLTTLNGTNGFVFSGITELDDVGYSVNTAGDFNGDGVDDLVIGAPGTSATRGAAYVLFGHTGNWPASFNITTLNGTNGFAIPGIVVQVGSLGCSVSGVGDFNADGTDDLLLGAYTAFSALRGAAYVLFGHTGNWPASFNLTTLNGTNGFIIPGIEVSGVLGSSVNTAGDLNGDGRDDLVLGAKGVSSNLGTAYVLFGQADGWPASFNLTTLNGTNGFAIPGIIASGQLGFSVGTARDLNGDGSDDLVLGAPGVSSNLGTAYVLFGQADGWPASFNLTILNGTNGFVIPGIAANARLGTSASAAGDLNGDSLLDLILGADDSNTGTSYVLFGQTGSWPEFFNLTALNGLNGFTVPGLVSGDKLGFSVNSAKDLNGDGLADLILGAFGASYAKGAAYVIFGRNTTLFTSTPQPLPPLLPVTIEVNIPPHLNTTFIPVTADILSVSNSTALISLIDNKGYAIVFSANLSVVPLFGNLTPIEVTGLSIARGNASLSDEPVFKACRVDGECSFSNTTTPLQQVFTVQGVDWKIIVPVVVGVAAAALGGGLIFYFSYYKKHQKTPNEKEMPLPDVVANLDTAPQRRDTQPKENYLQIASAYQDGAY